MKANDIFSREDGGIDEGLADLRRQRGLDENAMQSRIGVEPIQQADEFIFAGGLVEDMRFGKDGKIVAGLFLSADVNFRGRVFANADEREAGLNAACFQSGNLQLEFVQKLVCDCPSIDEVCALH